MCAACEGIQTLSNDGLMLLGWYRPYHHNEQFVLGAKVVQGILASEPAETLADSMEEHGQAIIDCTTRQCVRIQEPGA